MPRTKSSQRWLQEHFDDVYVKKAQAEGYRSRAVYKLQEIDDKETLLQPGMVVVDLGAAPGSWTEYVAKKLAGQGQVIALDILPMDPISGVHVICGDFREDEVLQQLVAVVPKSGVDLVLSDMAPNLSGSAGIDMPRAMYLAELAFNFAENQLKPGGSFVMKVFHGEGFDALVKAIRNRFLRVVIRKPQASRARSRETYLVAKGFKA